MKLKGLTKLALSGVALAAVAATLGTSTYAWYVTNSSATVTGVQGSAQAGGLGNVLVAQKSSAQGALNGHGTFEKTQAINTTNMAQTTTAAGLVPYTPVSAADSTAVTSTAATLLNGDTKWVDSKAVELTTGKAGKAYLEFDVWVLSTDATKVNFNFSIENTTAADKITQQVAYAATGIGTTTQGTKFAVNIVDALRIAYTQYDYTEAQANSTTASDGTPANSSVFFDSSKATDATGVATGATFVDASSFDAHSYYHAVLGASDKILEAGPTVNGIKAQEITLTKGVESRLHFYVWLEGTDAQCFDSCSGQSFNIGLEFVANKQANTPTQP